jgi:endonuclease/exonuclease/phosphatase family metal-dependent hydrolase
MVSFIRKLNLWLVLFTLLAYAAPYISPAQMSFFMFVGVAYPWLLLFNILFVLIWAVSRMRFWWVSALTILLGWVHLSSVWGLNFYKNTEGGQNPAQQSVALPAQTPLRVMTYNISGFALRQFKNKIAARLDLSRFFEKQAPDILCFQEFMTNKSDEAYYQQLLTDIPFLKTYPYVARFDKTAVVYFSRFPIQQTFDFNPERDNTTNGSTYADINIAGRLARVYNMQLRSNNVSDIAEKLAKNGELSDDDSWFAFGRMLKRFRRNGIVRSREAEMVKKDMVICPYPKILCGDLNDIPVSYTYDVLAEGMVDGFRTWGKGSASTYNGNIPALRIDYILNSKNFRLRSYQTLKVPYSDHFPVVADMVF